MASVRRHPTATDRAYCGCPVEAHDPVSTRHDGTECPFCNWACLREYVDREALTTGTSCEWEPA